MVATTRVQPIWESVSWTHEREFRASATTIASSLQATTTLLKVTTYGLLLPLLLAVSPADADFRVDRTFNDAPFLCRVVGAEQHEAYRVLALLIGLFLIPPLASSPPVARAQSAGEFEVLRHDPAGHGLLARCRNKTVLWVEGTPEQMGRAHGALLADDAKQLCERTVYLVGAGDSLHSGRWFFDRMAEIDRRTRPHVPEKTGR